MKIEDKLSRSQNIVLETLKEEKALTYEQLAEITGLSYDGVRGRVSELKKMGYGINKMRNNKQTYMVVEDEKSSYNRPDTIQDSMAQRIKGVDDFFNITDFLDTVKKTKIKKNKNFNYIPALETNKHAVLVLSDLHFGEIIVDDETKRIIYNTDVAYDRMDILSERVVEQLKKNKVKHLFITGLGDMVDGDMIYRNHIFRIEKSAIEQVQDAVKAISNFIKYIVSKGITVEMYNVRGNHGITNYQNLEEDNWDNVVYDMLQIVFMENDNVLITNFKGSQGKVQVGNKNFVLYHGEKMGAQIKTASGLRQFRGLCGKYKLNDGDIILVGHLHEFGIEYDQGKFLIRNGSLADASEYALKLNLYSEPEQTLLLFDDDTVYPTVIPIEVY